MNKHLLYLKYVVRHKWFVFVECLRLGIVWQGIIHDWHKFLPDEWFPYVDYFYGNRSDDILIRDAFDRAWNRHQKRGKHHWQYWVMFMDSDQEDGKPVALPMPDKYILEMAADWIGAGRAIHGQRDAAGWYKRVKDVTILESTTRRVFEKAIGYNVK